MNATLKFAAVAVLALAIGIGVVQLRPSPNNVGSDPSPSASPSPVPLVWSPASIDQDWPAPVRTEPDGDPVIIPFAYGSLDYLDPQGDIESPDMPWIDIQRVTNGGSVLVDVAATAPYPHPGSNEPWIVYGLVLDTDLDGVADVRLGLDIIPAEIAVDRGLIPAGGDAADRDNVTRGWKTDLRTGATEIGVAGYWICQCGWGGEGMKWYPGNYPTGRNATVIRNEDGPGRPGSGPKLIPGRFYVWASEIQDGRVVATDYAPDTGWLEVSGPSESIPPGRDGSDH